MVPYDVPVVAHDMILRFMGVDFARLGGGSATLVPSAVGNNLKPISGVVEGGGSGNSGSGGAESGPKTTPEQDKAMWEGTLGSAFLLDPPPSYFFRSGCSPKRNVSIIPALHVTNPIH